MGARGVAWRPVAAVARHFRGAQALGEGWGGVRCAKMCPKQSARRPHNRAGGVLGCSNPELL